MAADVFADVERRMEKAVEALQRELQAIRTGRASPALVERLPVEYYGTPTPLQQIAAIHATDVRTLTIQPWDRKALPDIERAILKSELGLTPSTDGAVIRLSIPSLTEERRRDLVKVVRRHAEEGRVAIRNIRRDHKDKLAHLEKAGTLSEDANRRAVDELQKLTDRFIKEVDALLAAKEAEIMEV